MKTLSKIAVLICFLALPVGAAERIGKNEATRLLVGWVASSGTHKVSASCLRASSVRLENGGYTIDLTATECAGAAAGSSLGTWRVDANTGELFVRQTSGKFGRPVGTGILREQREVTIGGVKEIWRLEWKSTPTAVCTPESGWDEWGTCPCSGFEFGEDGDLDLVRVGPGVPEDRLHLTPFYSELSTPGNKAVLRRWPVAKGDSEAEAGPAFTKKVKSRPPVSLINLADYDRDGHAAEFVLQVGSGPCGHQQAIVVGIDAQNPRLHAFGTAENPQVPIVLERPGQWETFRLGTGDVPLLQYGCGDHGTEEEEEIVLGSDAKGLHGARSWYACRDVEPNRGKLLKKEAL